MSKQHQWSYRREKADAVGPMEERELIALVRNGTLTSETLVMSPTRTRGKWVAIAQIPSLVKLIPKEESTPMLSGTHASGSESNPFHAPSAVDIGSRTADSIRKNFLPLEPRSKPTILSLRLTMIVMAINCLLIWCVYEAARGPNRSMLQMTQFVTFAVQVLLIFVTAVLFLRWQYRAYANLQVACDKPLKTTPGWSCGCYFIPFINFFAPRKPFMSFRHEAKPTLG